MEVLACIDWEAVIRTLIDAAILGVLGFIGKVVKGIFDSQKKTREDLEIIKNYTKEDIKNTIESIYNKAVTRGYVTTNELEVCDKQSITYLNKLNGNSFVEKRLEDLHAMRKKNI